MAEFAFAKGIKPDTKGVVRLPISIDLDGSEVALWVHVIRGLCDGPTLTLLSTTHGDQWFTIEAMRRVVVDLKPGNLQGTVLAIPVANPIAFNRLTRCMPDRSDAPDMQRVFPGKTNWLNEQIARTISEQILPGTDYLLDLHACPWGAALMMVVYGSDLPDSQLIAKSEEMARAFGCSSINKARLLSVFPGPKAVLSYATGQLGIPGIAVEIGGPGFAPELEESWLQSNVTGVWNVMRYLGMLEGDPRLPPKYLFWERMVMITPQMGGYLEPEIGAEALMKEVPRNHLLGRVLSPYTFEVMEELRAPADGVLILAPRAYPVRPGDWSFALADTAPEVSRWEYPE